ncbi:MAG: rod shape-determining protein MreC [Dysgonamonadaceae bacterium]|nr:rod shape-determining protein MreC [Dysgonamonadaceae bacterium]
MKNLIRFIFNNFHWLLFFALIYFSAWLLINNSEIQRSRYLVISHEIAGRMHTASSGISSYIHLKRDNEALTERIAGLEQELMLCRKQLENINHAAHLRDSTFVMQPIPAGFSSWRFISARLVHNSISRTENYITLNRGTNDGVRENMGVLSAKGTVAGLVMSVSPNFSRVISLLNPKSRLSCKISSTNFFGSLLWDGKDPRYCNLGELPSHAVFKTGDTIVTSGYSATFPEGIPVGIVTDALEQKSGRSNYLRINLLTDFSTIREVLIVENRKRDEQTKIEKEGAE